MVKKAKIDILKNLPDIEIREIETQAEVQIAQLPVSGNKWALNKLLLIGAPALIVVLVITGALWFYLSRTVTSSVVQIKSVTPVAKIAEKQTTSGANLEKNAVIEPAKMNNAYFKDFVVELKDKTGKSKILMCDIVLDLKEGNNIAELESRKDVRNLIYQMAKGKNVVALRSIEERKKLKNELSAELNKLCGEGIQNVYFTNFVIM